MYVCRYPSLGDLSVQLFKEAKLRVTVLELPMLFENLMSYVKTCSP